MSTFTKRERRLIDDAIQTQLDAQADDLNDMHASSVEHNETRELIRMYEKIQSKLSAKQSEQQSTKTAKRITSMRNVLIGACSEDVRNLLRDSPRSVVARACSKLIDSASVTLALIDETDLRDELTQTIAHQCDVWLFG